MNRRGGGGSFSSDSSPKVIISLPLGVELHQSKTCLSSRPYSSYGAVVMPTASRNCSIVMLFSWPKAGKVIEMKRPFLSSSTRRVRMNSQDKLAWVYSLILHNSPKSPLINIA